MIPRTNSFRFGTCGTLEVDVYTCMGTGEAPLQALRMVRKTKDNTQDIVIAYVGVVDVTWY
ncbi:hypothetical protein M404DRAFT_1000073 [Pisolithus tinctorius Marx 270]|uniref:Uncharacterized protein n=1 Tax=Pisolithus tinctorius Marx 270 TaxID=870435 RepID=A0A0C3PAP4_PISTI|nr:hypothetical protein M404DRAFT_1000073 [Pisolithus tinctorius Marx 270]